MGDDVLYTVSPKLVRADSLERMANLTRDAIALTSSSTPLTAANAAVWEAALAGAQLAEVALPHSMCGDSHLPPTVPMPVDVAARLASSTSSSTRRRASVAVTAPEPEPSTACTCACTMTCDLRGAAQLAAAQAALGY